jgi:hypothetical protein
MVSRKKTFFAALLALGMVLSVQSNLGAWVGWYSPFGSAYLPAVLYANTSLDDECGNYGAFVRGGRSWNLVTCTDFAFMSGGTTTRSAPINDDYQVLTWDTCDPGVLGVTYLMTNGPNRECDVLFCTGWNWNCGPGATTFNQIDLESVACHEFGHVLALGHTPISQATMYAYMNYGDDSKRTLHQDDIDGVCALY